MFEPNPETGDFFGQYQNEITKGAPMSKRLCKDWSGYTLMDGMGKVTVQIRNGYLSTGYDHVTKTLPPFLRCYEHPGNGGKTVRKWVHGVSETHIPELDDMYPNAVVQLYRKKAREAQEAKEAEAAMAETPAATAHANNPTRSASTRLSARA